MKTTKEKAVFWTRFEYTVGMDRVRRSELITIEEPDFSSKEAFENQIIVALFQQVSEEFAGRISNIIHISKLN